MNSLTLKKRWQETGLPIECLESVLPHGFVCDRDHDPVGEEECVEGHRPSHRQEQLVRLTDPKAS